MALNLLAADMGQPSCCRREYVEKGLDGPTTGKQGHIQQNRQHKTKLKTYKLLDICYNCHLTWNRGYIAKQNREVIKVAPLKENKIQFQTDTVATKFLQIIDLL